MPFREDLEERKERAFRLYRSLLDCGPTTIEHAGSDLERAAKYAERACYLELVFDNEWKAALRRQGIEQ